MTKLPICLLPCVELMTGGGRAVEGGGWFELFFILGRVAKFVSKVGSRRTTII